MTRPRWRVRHTAKAAILAAMTFLAMASCGGDDRIAGFPKKPNFIIFLADDLGAEDVGAYGHPAIRTPNIDALARGGLRFDRAFLTCSTCSPIRCSILTGRYPHATGAPDAHQPLPEDQVTFVDRLRDAGYYTAAAGKWHLGDPAATRFDRVRRASAATSGCDHWVETLRDRPPGKPFFLWLASHDPHRPYAPRTLAQPYKLEEIVVPPFLPDLRETRIDLAVYYEEITRLDDYVGRVLGELARQGDAGRTLVIFMSDNGRPFPRCKTTVYDSGIRTPIIVHFPGVVRPGGVSDSLISSVDIAPTILDLARVARPGSMQGVSFAPLLKEPRREVRREVYAEQNWHDYAARKRAVRTRRFKYIRNFYPDLPNTPPGDVVRTVTYQAMRRLRDEGRLTPAQMDCFLAPRPPEELYEVETDPHEIRNLAGDPARATDLEEMRRLLQRWQEETADREPPERRPDLMDRETGERLPAASGRDHATSHPSD